MSEQTQTCRPDCPLLDDSELEKIAERAADMSPEELTKLRQFELEHEEELQRLQLENNKLDFQYFQAEVDDKGSARLRDEKFLVAGTRNYRADFMFVLAVGMITMLVWIVWKDQGINEYVKGIFTLVSDGSWGIWTTSTTSSSAPREAAGRRTPLLNG